MTRVVRLPIHKKRNFGSTKSSFHASPIIQRRQFIFSEPVSLNSMTFTTPIIAQPYFAWRVTYSQLNHHITRAGVTSAPYLSRLSFTQPFHLFPSSPPKKKTQVLGPRLMENRKPFELRKVLIVYNAIQVAFSIWLFYEVGYGPVRSATQGNGALDSLRMHLNSIQPVSPDLRDAVVPKSDTYEWSLFSFFLSF